MVVEVIGWALGGRESSFSSLVELVSLFTSLVVALVVTKLPDGEADGGATFTILDIGDVGAEIEGS